MTALSGFRSLHFAVRPRVLARYLGQALVLLAGFSVVPAAAALAGGSRGVAVRYLAVILTLAAVGAAGARLRCSDRIQPNEALVVSALVFLLSGLAMAIPLAGYGLAPMDAIFESISGVTTTGLSTLASVEGRPWPFHFGRAWLQWVGGLGVVVLALAFTIPSGVAAKRLGFDDREADDYVGGTRGHARRILVVYLALTGSSVALCALAGMGAFEALTHGMAAVSTGGFATADASLAGRSAWVQAAVSLGCLAGAVPFALYYRASLRAVLRSSRLWTLLALTALGAGLIGASIARSGAPGADGPSGWAAWGHATWMAVSAQTTAGFSSLSVAALPSFAKGVLICGMLVGGGIGSTAGGIKILRFMLLGQVVVARLLRPSMPDSAKLPLRIEGHRVVPSEIEAAAALVFTHLTVLGASWLTFLAYGRDPLDSLFEVASALGTVGLSAGATGPDLEPVLKGVLCVDMLMGRVELFAFLVLLFPMTWIGRRRRSQ